MVYRDFITMLIIRVLKLLLVRYGNASLEAIFYKIYIVYIDFITTLIIGVLSLTITPIITFSRASVSKIQ